MILVYPERGGKPVYCNIRIKVLLYTQIGDRAGMHTVLIANPQNREENLWLR